MFFASRKAAAPPLNLACLPGLAAAVQLASESPSPRPVLAKALVCQVAGRSEARLEHLARELNLRRTPLRVLLEVGDYQFLQTEMPNVPAEELRTAVRWQLKDVLRQPVDAVTLDLLTPPEDAHGSRRSSGFAVVAANELLRARMLLFRPWNSAVRVIDVPEMAQRNLADRLEEVERATAVLSITPGGCLLTASRAGVLHFVRSFDLSSLSLKASETVRREQFDRLVLELQRTIDVLEHQYSFLSVSTLWLSPFEHAEDLLSLLIENLYLPVKLIDLAQIFDTSRCALPASPDEQAALFHVLGMALRGPEGAP